nr:hypothetical protein [Mesorhizobium sp.]
MTANTSTLYAHSGADLANDGPTVIEVKHRLDARLSR